MIENPRHHLFDSAIGICALAWTGRGLIAVQLPERDRAATARRVAARAEDAVGAAGVTDTASNRILGCAILGMEGGELMTAIGIGDQHEVVLGAMPLHEGKVHAPSLG